MFGFHLLMLTYEYDVIQNFVLKLNLLCIINGHLYWFKKFIKIFVFLRSLIYIMELKCLNLRFLIYLTKISYFLCILPTVQDNKQIFCKTWHSLNFNVTLIMKFNLENQIFYLCPNVARFFKNVFKQQMRAHLKQKVEGRAFWCGSDEKMCRMWLGRGNEVARTPPIP